MSAAVEAQYTFEEYLARERVAPYKSEYYQGRILAMSGGSPRHNLIGVNIVAALRGRLRGTPCRPHNSDQRIRIPSSGLATYPDVSVVCGQLELDSQDRDAIVNPQVIFEVLPSSTESYDRGKKFELYPQLESLREYVLVAQDKLQVERFVRQADGSWLLSIVQGLDAVLQLLSPACDLPLAEIYEDVTFGPEENVSSRLPQ